MPKPSLPPPKKNTSFETKKSPRPLSCYKTNNRSTETNQHSAVGESTTKTQSAFAQQFAVFLSIIYLIFKSLPLFPVDFLAVIGKTGSNPRPLVKPNTKLYVPFTLTITDV
mmetsp:Transcript_24210/g.51424  ORF Transcript_24210/g.51424 Transcript_24210/m.51424 type:complete len:111 (+) Transcript_24210:1372-1704(+)